MSLHPAVNGTEQRLDVIIQLLQRLVPAPAPDAPQAVELREPAKARTPRKGA